MAAGDYRGRSDAGEEAARTENMADLMTHRSRAEDAVKHREMMNLKEIPMRCARKAQLKLLKGFGAATKLVEEEPQQQRARGTMQTLACRSFW